MQRLLVCYTGKVVNPDVTNGESVSLCAMKHNPDGAAFDTLEVQVGDGGVCPLVVVEYIVVHADLKTNKHN